MAEETIDGAEASEEVTANPETEAPEASTEEGETTWRSAIEDEKVRKLADRFNTPGDMAKAYAELNTEFSQRIKVPGADATEEDLSKFRKLLGVPESVDNYDLTRPEHIDEETFASEPFQNMLQGVVGRMHDAGATQAQVDAAIGTYFELEAAQQAATQQNDQQFSKDAEAGLRSEWGEDYDANLSFAKQALSKFEFGEQLKQTELSNGMLLGSNPDFLRVMANYGRITGEGSLQLGLRGTEAGASLQKQYDTLTDDIHNAMALGNTEKAKRLDAERRDISESLFGTGPVPGRAA
jgi:hypothetical protein